MNHRLPPVGQPRPVERVLAQLQQHGRKVEPHSGYWMAQCPANDDPRPSLSIREGSDGRALLTCHAGCHWREVVGALGLQVKDLFVPEPQPSRSAPKPACIEYGYRDPSGALVYQVVRTPQKQFWVRRPTGTGGWEKGLGTATRIPYRLPELLAAAADHPVFVVEGEKDVETLRAHGLIASTNVFGAGKWRDDYSPYFRGRRVVVLPDNDAPGQAHAEAVVASLRAAGVAAVALVARAREIGAVEWGAIHDPGRQASHGFGGMPECGSIPHVGAPACPQRLRHADFIRTPACLRGVGETRLPGS